MIQDIKRLFWKAVDTAEKMNTYHGFLGRYLEDGSGQVEVPGRGDMVYVRIGTAAETDTSVSVAKNLGTPLIFGLPVKLKLEDGVYVIIGVDHAMQGPGAGGAINAGPPHHHRTGSGNEYEHEMTHLEAGRVRWNGSGFVVYVSPLRYLHGVIWKRWAGGTLDLVGSKPATVGHWGWVLVGINRDSNTLVTAAGATVPYATALPESEIENIAWNTDWTPLTAIRIREDDTHLGYVDRYVDAKGWLNTGVTDHTLLTNIGTNSHAQIDTHIADATIHFTEGSIVHNNLSGLAIGDPHTQYPLLAGRAGGQTIIGDTASGGNLKLSSTAHATKGDIRLLDPVMIGADQAPGDVLHVLSPTAWEGFTLENRLANNTAALFRNIKNRAGAAPNANDFVGGFEGRIGTTASSVAVGAMTVQAKATGSGSERGEVALSVRDGATWRAGALTIAFTGNVGIGVTSPQGRLHGHDGTGGFLHVTKTAIDGTAQTIIPDGTGDVVRGLRYTVIIRLSSGITTHGIGFVETGGDADIYNNGTNTEILKLRVNANGSVDVRRSTGTLTYTISLWLVWM